MISTLRPSVFFVAGGTLELDVISYVHRPADDELLQLTLAGEYCNVLAARQTGKSSLVVRTIERLKELGVKPVRIDLTSIGNMVSASEWYFGLLSELTKQLDLHVDMQAWWNNRKEKSPVQRFSDFLPEVILREITDLIVIFIDEIDSTLNLRFTDDFFAAIRALYNARPQNADLKRLTFVLIGVARPAELIKDRARTPYNIGTGIEITDFQLEELGSFETALEKTFPGQGKLVLERVLAWTGGQPYLTQKLCAEVVKQTGTTFSEDEFARLVNRLFLGDMARTELNLSNIRKRVLSSPRLAKMLRIYKRVLVNVPVRAEEQSIEQNELKLTGLVKATPKGTLEVRNRIYEQCFDEKWIQESMPTNVTLRVAIISTAIAVLAVGVAIYFYYKSDAVLAQRYIDDFQNTNSSEVKINSLAGLFGLGDDYAVQARNLFNKLDADHKLEVFNLSTPSNVAQQLVVVVEELYQNVENSQDGNKLLKAMANDLQQVSERDAVLLRDEIDAWMDGREATDFSSAISSFTTAFSKSRERKDENPAILFERAGVYMNHEDYSHALSDYNDVLDIDATRADTVRNAILGNQELADYYREHSSIYPNLLKPVPIPTSLPPTLTPSPSLTPVPLPQEITDGAGVKMVLVPTGKFIAGDNGVQQYLDSFYIDKYEVTNASFEACVNASVCYPLKDVSSSSRLNYFGNPQYSEYPLIYVDWNTADTYCKWRGAQLPTDAQWEKAARGTEGRTYPWGNEFDCKNVNGGDFCGSKDTVIVDSYKSGASPFGALNMSGNVWEWVAEGWLRGGAWDSKNDELRASYRNEYVKPDFMTFDIGFRCASAVTNDLLTPGSHSPTLELFPFDFNLSQTPAP